MSTITELLEAVRKHGGTFRIDNKQLAYSGPPLTDEMRAVVKREKFAVMLAVAKVAEQSANAPPPPVQAAPGRTWSRDDASDVMSEVCRRLASAVAQPWWTGTHASLARAMMAGVAVLLLKRDPAIWTSVSDVGVLLEKWRRDVGDGPSPDNAESPDSGGEGVPLGDPSAGIPF